MCGICGIYNAASNEKVSQQLIEKMADVLQHRGPDDQGYYLDGPLGLGFTRLSIIDLNGGHQPMGNEDDTIHVVFNGEIWNYQSLRHRLMSQGHRFTTHSDTEVIVHAYEEYGIDCLKELHGMFGLGIWDSRKQHLLLARDRAGKKPLYYSLINGNLIFASEIKALLIHPAMRRAANLQAMVDFLSVRYVPGPATLFEGVYKVQPGQCLLYTHGEIHTESYWNYRFEPTEQRPMQEYFKGIRKHIQRAVTERMMADVPVGALLSGGVDSSIITGFMSNLTTHKVQTFAVGFDQPDYSELPYAQIVARHFGTEHHELVVSSTDMIRYWPLLTWHRDEPVSEPSDLGVYLISQMARQYVKVVLSGEGGDELFAGYPKYIVDRFARYYHLIPQPIRDTVIQPLLERLPYNMRKLKMAASNLSQAVPERWMSWFGIFNGPIKYALLSPQLQQQVNLDASRAFKQCLEQNPQRDDLSSMLYLDTRFWLPDNLLMKSDKMTMAASLEARMPLLDQHLIAYAASIPSTLKTHHLQAKYMLKQAFADFLPTEILTRKKMGFNVPTGIWFREAQRETITQLLLSDRLRDRGFFNEEFIRKMLIDHIAGRINYQAPIFTLASLELWFRVFIDPPQLQQPTGSVSEILIQEPVPVTLR